MFNRGDVSSLRTVHPQFRLEVLLYEKMAQVAVPLRAAADRENF